MRYRRGRIDTGLLTLWRMGVTFEKWWMEYHGSIKWVDEGAPQAKKAWEYQQTIIDELRADLMEMYKDRGVPASWWSKSDEG